MRYLVTTQVMILWFFVILIAQNTAVTGDPKCITFNNPQPNVKKWAAGSSERLLPVDLLFFLRLYRPWR